MTAERTDLKDIIAYSAVIAVVLLIFIPFMPVVRRRAFTGSGGFNKSIIPVQVDPEYVNVEIASKKLIPEEMYVETTGYSLQSVMGGKELIVTNIETDE